MLFFSTVYSVKIELALQHGGQLSMLYVYSRIETRHIRLLCLVTQIR